MDVNWKVKESVSVTTRLAQLVSPWTGFVIVPIFALANAGIELSTGALGDAVSSRVTWGIAAGLVIGKTVGVSLFTYLAVRLNIATMPQGVTLNHVFGGGAVAGIGFTVALFIAKLAFVDEDGTPQHFLEEAILGILVASMVAAVLGWLLLRRAASIDSAADLAVQQSG